MAPCGVDDCAVDVIRSLVVEIDVEGAGNIFGETTWGEGGSGQWRTASEEEAYKIADEQLEMGVVEGATKVALETGQMDRVRCGEQLMRLGWRR